MVNLDDKMKSSDISYNFSVAKVLSILMVATGHYFGGILWIPTTVALFVFAFSSGYFSALKYTGNFSIKQFWIAKVVRLGFGLVFINFFLLLLFVLQGKSNIVTWDSVLGVVGLSSVLNWLNLPYKSPFGSGLWFLTALYIFYLVYPLVERINRNLWRASVFALLMLIVTTFLNFNVHVPYELWMTAFGFLFGSYAATIQIRMPLAMASGILIASVVTMLALNKFWCINSLNYYMMLLASISVCGILLAYRLPDFFARFSSIFSECIFEIYLIHTYLFLRIHDQNIVGYIASISLILLVANTLSKLRKMIVSDIKNRLVSGGLA